MAVQTEVNDNLPPQGNLRLMQFDLPPKHVIYFFELMRSANYRAQRWGNN